MNTYAKKWCTVVIVLALTLLNGTDVLAQTNTPETQMSAQQDEETQYIAALQRWYSATTNSAMSESDKNEFVQILRDIENTLAIVWRMGFTPTKDLSVKTNPPVWLIGIQTTEGYKWGILIFVIASKEQMELPNLDTVLDKINDDKRKKLPISDSDLADYHIQIVSGIPEVWRTLSYWKGKSGNIVIDRSSTKGRDKPPAILLAGKDQFLVALILFTIAILLLLKFVYKRSKNKLPLDRI